MFLVSETLMPTLTSILIVNLTKDPIELVTEREGDVIIFEIEDMDGDGIISPVEIATLQAMTEEAALQIYDYFPTVSTESRVDIEVENTTKFESAQIDGFVIENPGVSYQVNDTLFFDNTGTDGLVLLLKLSLLLVKVSLDIVKKSLMMNHTVKLPLLTIMN